MEAKIEKIRHEFSERLKREFERAGLRVSSPTQIANEFNRRYPQHRVAAQTVRKWMLADAIPAQARLLAIADWLQLSPQWLRFGMGPRQIGKAEKNVYERAENRSEIIVLGSSRTALIPLVELLARLTPSNVELVENIVRCVLADQEKKA